MPSAESYFVRPRKASKTWKSGQYSPLPPGEFISGLIGALSGATVLPHTIGST